MVIIGGEPYDTIEPIRIRVDEYLVEPGFAIPDFSSCLYLTYGHVRSHSGLDRVTGHLHHVYTVHRDEHAQILITRGFPGTRWLMDIDEADSQAACRIVNSWMDTKY